MITARSLQPDDLEAVVGLLHAYDRRWFGEPLLTLEDVAAEWRTPELDLATDTEGWFDAVADEDGRLVAFGTLGTRGGIEVAVHEDWAGAGLEDALLDRWEHEARRRGFRAVHRQLPAADEGGLRRLVARGWVCSRTGWLLGLAPDVPVEPRDVPAGYRLRPMQEADLPAVHAVVDEAFAPWSATRRPYADWRAGTIDRADVTLEHAWVVVRRGEVVGACLVMDPAEPSGPEPEAWVPQLAVVREHRRQGLARELLVRTAVAARARGVPRLALYTHSDTGARRLYERLGMVVRHTLVECDLAL